MFFPEAARKRARRDSELTVFEQHMLKKRKEKKKKCPEEKFMSLLVSLLLRLPTETRDIIKFQIHKLVPESLGVTLNLEIVNKSIFWVISTRHVRLCRRGSMLEVPPSDN